MKSDNLMKVSFTIPRRRLLKPVSLCVCALIILSMVSVFAINTVQAATTTYFGNTAIGTYTDTNDANSQSISYFKSTTTGSITDIIAYISGTTTGKAITALYAVNGNSPTTLLKQSNPANIGTTYSWVDFQLPTSYTVTSGTTYGLAIMSNVGINVREVGETGERGHNAVSTYTSGFANPFGGIWGTDNTGAMSIYASGTSSSTPTPTPTPTTTPTPRPTPTPTVTPTSSSASNLTPFPSAWKTSTTGMQFAVGGCSNVVMDSGALYNGNPTIRIDPITSVNPAREANGPWLSVRPGQTIVFSCWIKTSTSTTGDKAVYDGARIGIDFYAAQRIAGTNSPTGATYNPITRVWPADNTGTTVRWGTSTWTQVTIAFVVPSQVMADGYGGYSAGQMVSPTGMVPWLQVTSGSSDAAVGWFAETTLQVS